MKKNISELFTEFKKKKTVNDASLSKLNRIFENNSTTKQNRILELFLKTKTELVILNQITMIIAGMIH
jgi:uncharacterized protein YcbK (DUF882 family)